MTFLRRIHFRIALLAVVALAAVGVGAGYAATRSTTPAIGTGVVVINTNLAYQGASAAGTGMVLTSNGEILTNNHVIAGATTIEVKIPNTKHTYTATVVGYDVTDDVAVLQLKNASHLRTVTIASTTPKVGAAVRAVGNANGGGVLVSAAGRVTAVGRTITVSDDEGGSETLAGLIETDAALQPGDSGGPLENASGAVVGMDTAASAGFQFARGGAGSGDGYAIPIAKALSIAKQIESGTATTKVHVGATGWLGVQVASAASAFDGGSSSGVAVVGVVPNGPAARAGLAAGDVITAIDGKAVTSPSAVQSLVMSKKPGAKLTVRYVDQSGAAGTVTVMLGTGPAQ
jgi:S1-C subfamily serine protease